MRLLCAGAGRAGGAARGLRWVATIAALAFGSAILGAAPALAPIRIETSAPHMGTLVRIVLYADTPAAGEAAAQAAFARIAAIEARLSDYRDDSEVAALSRASAGVPVPVSEDLFAVLAASDALARRTGGAFDITAGRLTHLWRRARRLNAWPEADRVAAARAAGGFAKVRLDPRRRTVTLAEAGIEIDAGGIAKGYAAEEALRVLRAKRRRRGAGRDRRRHRRRGSAARAAGLDGGDSRARASGGRIPSASRSSAPRSPRPATPSSG